MEDSSVLVHDETHHAEAESSGFNWTPYVQYAAAHPLVFAPSDDTNVAQCTVTLAGASGGGFISVDA